MGRHRIDDRFSLMSGIEWIDEKSMASPNRKTSGKKTSLRPSSVAREKTDGRLVGGKFSELANYADLFDRANDGILLVDVRNFEVLETNRAFRDLLETERPLEGSSFLEFFPEGEASEVKSWLLGTGEEEIEMRTASGRFLEIARAKVRLADYCETFQIIVRDVTAEKNRRAALEKQSLTDEMTGLSNFRSFKSRLALEHERAKIKSQKYSVLFVDVDHFKHYNDRNGHPAGDGALKKVASILKDCSGRNEFVARYGGEEFVVLCSNFSSGQAGDFAEKVRKAIESADFAHGASQPLGKVTVSIGVAEYLGETTPDEVLKRADEALYRSKKEGRNRVTIDVPAAIGKRVVA